MILYELVSAGASPLTLADAKSFMKVTSSDDDGLIQSMIDAATLAGETYTARPFRATQWKKLQDDFSCPIVIDRSDVSVIDSIDYIGSGSPVPVDSDVYNLERGLLCSNVYEAENKSWPEDVDNIPQAVSITFTTEAVRQIDMIINALQRHVLFLYQNRGDCDCLSDTDTLKQSGAINYYAPIMKPRIC